MTDPVCLSWRNSIFLKMISVSSVPVRVYVLVLVMSTLRPAASRPAPHPHPHPGKGIKGDPEPVSAVSVLCHADAMEVVLRADVLGSGLRVEFSEVGLGAACKRDPSSSTCCRPTRSKPDLYTIHTSLTHCGTQLTVTRESLEYTNVLIYTPTPTLEDVVRLDGAVIPVKCKYLRRYSVNSSSVIPTWSPFGSSGSASSALDFGLKLMSDDWLYERTSSVYWFGDTIHIEASVSVAIQTWLNVFVDRCVASTTPSPDEGLNYDFIDNNGCLMDSWYSGPRSTFLPRMEGNKLRILIKAFRFFQQTGNLIYITCYLKAVPAVLKTSSQNRACTFLGDRWKSVDGDHQVCHSCEVIQAPTIDPLSPTHSPPLTLGQRSTASRSDSEWGKITTLGPLVVLVQENDAESTSSVLPSPTYLVDIKLTTGQLEPHVVSTTAASSATKPSDFQTVQQVSNLSLTLAKILPTSADLPQLQDDVVEQDAAMKESATFPLTTLVPQTTPQTSTEQTYTKLYTDQAELSILNTTVIEKWQEQILIPNVTLPTMAVFPSTTDFTQEQPEWETTPFQDPLVVVTQENVTKLTDFQHTSTPEPVEIIPTSDQPEQLLNTTVSPVMEQSRLQTTQQVSNFSSTKTETFPTKIDFSLLEDDNLDEEWRETMAPLYMALNQDDPAEPTSIPDSTDFLLTLTPEAVDIKTITDQLELLNTTVSPVMEQSGLQTTQQVSNFSSTKTESFPTTIGLLEDDSLDEESREIPVLHSLSMFLNQDDSIESTSIPETSTDLVNLEPYTHPTKMVFSTTVSPESSELELHQVSNFSLTDDFQKDNSTE